jgi:zinc protease
MLRTNAWWSSPRCVWPASPPLAPRAPKGALPYSSLTLDSGLRVYVIEDHETPQVAIVTCYRVGSKDELPGKTGFAHLFEHMMASLGLGAPQPLTTTQFP